MALAKGDWLRGRAHPSHGWGRWFKSSIAHQHLYRSWLQMLWPVLFSESSAPVCHTFWNARVRFATFISHRLACLLIYLRKQNRASFESFEVWQAAGLSVASLRCLAQRMPSLGAHCGKRVHAKCPFPVRRPSFHTNLGVESPSGVDRRSGAAGQGVAKEPISGTDGQMTP